MIIKPITKLSNYCRFRLFDKTTLSFVGNQFFSYRKYGSLRKFADQYADFTGHRIAIVCIDRYDYMTGSWEWFQIYEVC